MLVMDEKDLQAHRDQRSYAIDRALVRYQHEMGTGGVGSDEERVVDCLVSLLHWCDERGVILEAALNQAEELFVDELEPEVLGESEGPCE